MKRYLKHLAVGSLLLFGATACADLDIANLNDPDAGLALAEGSDVLSLVGGSFNSWFYGNYSYDGPAMAISNAAFQHNAPWANSGMEKYGRLPRIAFINAISDGDYNYLTLSWFRSYRAIAAVADGLKALDRPEIQETLTADELGSARAFGKFVQGLAHASVAVFYSQGFAVDETTDFSVPQEPLAYGELMEVALDYFDEAISLSNGASWTLPLNWMQASLTGPQFARVAHSWKARFAAANARTWEERQNPPWGGGWAGIIADVDAGITEDYVPFYDDYGGWSNDALGYGAYPYWSQLAYFVYGMADQSGAFQAWNALSLNDKSYNLPNGDPVIIITPDLRFPQGATIDEQRATPGAYFRPMAATGSEVGYTWKRPDRGTWRWSWYKHSRGEEYWVPGETEDFYQAEIRLEEMRLLKAEGLYHQGNKAGAAGIINETRTKWGLSSTDAAGTNTSCVPKLPGSGQGYDTAPGNSQCGGLFEMLKWEKRMENTFRGPLGALWFFDGRGWGDLWKDTFLNLPIPCGEAQTLQLLPCQSFGGGGEGSAPLSNYKWNGEG